MLKVRDFYSVVIHVIHSPSEIEILASDDVVFANNAQDAARLTVDAFNKATFSSLELCSALYADYSVIVLASLDAEPEIFYYKEYDYDC